MSDETPAPRRSHPLLRSDDQNDWLCDSSRDPVEELATEFAERYRNGEQVSVEEYASRFPQHAEEIRDLFPTIAAMERLTTKRVRDSAMLDSSKPKQLGDYRIIGEIARGGMGIVYEAEQISLGRRVAVKVLPTHALSRQKDIRRFQREAQTAANLHHSNIVPVFGVGVDKGQHYIVMQYIRGVGLDEILNELCRVFLDESRDESTSSGSRLNAIVRSAANLVDSKIHIQSTTTGMSVDTLVDPLEKKHQHSSSERRSRLRSALGSDYFYNVAKIGFQVSKALQYAHQQDTLHRDIKPGNLLLDEEGRVWIADFGLAKAIEDDDVTRSDDIVGTIAYVAPERFRGSTTRSSDIYSLGVTLYEMLTLQKAYPGADRVEVLKQATTNGLPHPRTINQGVPIDLETIVMKAAACEPLDRYKNAGALARDLEAFMNDRPIEARRLSYLEHTFRWCRRNRLLATLSLGIVLLVAVVIGLLAFGYRQAEEQRFRAEQTTADALNLIEGIYSHFTTNPFSDPSIERTGLEGKAVDNLIQTSGYEPTPVSRDTAMMLENLLGFYDKLAAESSDSTAVDVKAISATRRVGEIHVLLEQLVVARSSYEKALLRIQELPEELRDSAEMRLETARIYNGLGLSYYRNYHVDSDKHVQHHQDAVNILQDGSSSPNEKFELATSLYLLHHSIEAFNDRNHRRARRKEFNSDGLLERARSILKDLIQEHPDRSEYTHLLARCLLPLQPWAVSFSREDHQKSIEILDRLIKKHPGNPEYRYELGQAHLMLWGRFRWDPDKSLTTQQIKLAEKDLRHILDVTSNLEVNYPNIPKYYKLKKHLHESLGYVLYQKSDWVEAELNYERAVDFQHLLIAHAEVPDEHVPWLYRLKLDFARGLIAADKLMEAKKMLAYSAEKLDDFITTREPEQPDDRWMSFRRWLTEIKQELSKLEAKEDQYDRYPVTGDSVRSML